MRPIIPIVMLLVMSGCGYLDDDLLKDDATYEQSFNFEGEEFGVGGLGMRGTYSHGCGGSWGSYSYSSRWRAPRIYLGVPGTSGAGSAKTWTPAPVHTSVTTAGERDDSDVEDETEIVSERELFAAADAYIAAGYEVRIVSPDEEINHEEAQLRAALADSHAL